eukprot:11131822-Ditylum_brightwellii.AAC.1
MSFVKIATNPKPYDLAIGLNSGSVTRAWCEAQHQERQDAYDIQQVYKNVTKNQLEQALPN